MNILLLDKDLNYCKNLINSVSALNANVRFSYIVNDNSELSRICDADIILANYDFCDGRLEAEFDNAKIIYMSDNSKNAISRSDIDLIIKKLEASQFETHDANVDNLLSAELAFIGFDLTLLGTKCMFKAIKIVYHTDSITDKNLLNYVYTEVGKVLNITEDAVKSNLHYASNRMFLHGDKYKISKYFYLPEGTKPSVKTIILTVIDNIKLKEKKLFF